MQLSEVRGARVVWAVAIAAVAAALSAGAADPSAPPSAEAQAIVGRLKRDLTAGIAIGHGEPMRRLRELGEERHAVPTLVWFLAPANGEGLRASAAAECLHDLGPGASAAAPALLAAIKNNDRFDRDKFAKALVAVAPPPDLVIPPALEFLASPDPDLRTRGAALLGSAGPAAAKAALPRLSALAADKTITDSRDRTNVVRALAQIAWPDCRDLFVRLIAGADGDPVGADAAISALEQMGPAAAPIAADLAAHIVRSDVARTLGAIGPDARAAVPALVKALGDPATASNAAEALAGIGLPDEATAAAAIPALARLAAGTDAFAAYGATGALAKVDRPLPPAVAALRAALGHAYMPARREAALGLGALKAATPEVVAALTDRLADPEEQIRAAAATALAEFGDAARPALARLRERAKTDTDPAARVAAAEALWRVGNEADLAAPLLAAAVSDNDGPEWPAAHALGRIKSARPDVVAALIKGFASRSDHTQTYVAQALAEIGPDARAALPALRAALTGTYEEPKPEAARAIYRIVGQRAAGGAANDDLARARRALAETLALRGSLFIDSYRRRAAEVLVELAPTDPAAAALIKPLSTDSDPAIRAIAAKAAAAK